MERPTQLPGRRPVRLRWTWAGKPVFLPRGVVPETARRRLLRIILAVNPDALDDFKCRWSDKLAFHGVTIVGGGRVERWETVLKALEAIRPDCTHAAIHDAARPLASPAARSIASSRRRRSIPAVIPGVPVNATLKRVAAVEEANAADPLDAILGVSSRPSRPVKRVVQTVDRRGGFGGGAEPRRFSSWPLRRSALRQITSSGKLRRPGCHRRCRAWSNSLGETVHVVRGESTNLKITRPDDHETRGGVHSRSLSKLKLTC